MHQACHLRSIFLTLGLSIAIGHAGEPQFLLSEDLAEESASRGAEVDLWTGEGVSIGGILFPHIHFLAAAGLSSADAPENLALGHHDPNREGITIQNIEFGSSLRLGDHLEGFAVYAAVIDQNDDWSGEWEEAFLKWKGIPGGFEVRGGRYFNRFGFYNALHPHGYFFVDKDLLEGRMLGEDSLTTEGGELTWNLPTRYPSAISYSYGEALLEDHAHVHGEEAHAEEALFEGESGYFSDSLHTLHWIGKWNYNDFHQFTGHVSVAWGDNGFGRDSMVYGAGLEYLWRENGLEAGGRAFRGRLAAIYREIDAYGGGHHDDHDHEETDDHDHEDEDDDHDHEEEERHEEDDLVSRTLTEWGVSSSLHFRWNRYLETSLGVSWVEGISGAGLDERVRVSPLVTWHATDHLRVKLQYNYDHVRDGRDEHGVWLGLGVDWGGPEVR